MARHQTATSHKLKDYIHSTAALMLHDEWGKPKCQWNLSHKPLENSDCNFGNKTNFDFVENEISHYFVGLLV